MRTTADYASIWKIAYPIILGSLATTVVNFTDTAFLARVGETELGASAITSVFYFLLVVIGVSLSIGAQITIARRAGEGNKTEIAYIFDHSLVILAGLSLISLLVASLLSPILFGAIIKSPEVRDAAITYMQFRSPGLLFTITGMAFRAFYTGIGSTRAITYSSVLMTVVNIILDYCLIFGHFGFPEMGIAGSALASAIAECIAFVYLVLFTVIHKEYASFELCRFKDFSLTRFKKIVTLSSPIMLQNLLSMGAWFIFFVLIERMGEHELAISNLVRSAYMVFMIPIWGFASATNSMVSNLIGQGKTAEVGQLIRKIIHLSLGTAVVILLISMFPHAWLLHLISGDAGLVNDAQGPYYITVAAVFLFSVSIILLSAVSGAGATRVALYIEFLNLTIYMVYVYIFAVRYPISLEMVWGAEIVYWVLMGVLSYIYLKTGKWSATNI